MIYGTWSEWDHRDDVVMTRRHSPIAFSITGQPLPYFRAFVYYIFYVPLRGYNLRSLETFIRATKQQIA